MLSYVLSLGLIALGMGVGALLRRRPLEKLMGRLQMTVLLGLSPIITVGAFWAAPLTDVRSAWLPVLGVTALVAGGALGFLASFLLGHDRKRRGSMFVSASFTNLGSFGGLVCFLFYGEGSYAFVALYRLLEEFLYLAVGFPLAKLHGDADASERRRHPLVRIFTDPFILISLSAMALGFGLHLWGPPRPDFYRLLNSALIPVTSVLLVIPVGFSMRFEAVGKYWREALAVGAVKFLALPVLVTGLAWALGLGSLAGGLALKTVFVLSAMPPAFYSLIPPRLYGLDQHQANACWLLGTGMLVVVVPTLFVLQGFFP